MDPLTQTALGALVAQACARRDRQGRAALAGGLGGMLPDADVLIRSASDPLLFLEYHRHFTHALAFVPVGALVAGTLAWLLGRGRWAWRELWLYAALGWLTHGPLDACTSYGTHLAWPFDEGRVAWGLIAIIDPLFTVPLLVGVGLGLSGRRLRRAWLVVALATRNCKSLPKEQRALSLVEARLTATLGFKPSRVSAVACAVSRHQSLTVAPPLSQTCASAEFLTSAKRSRIPRCGDRPD